MIKYGLPLLVLAGIYAALPERAPQQAHIFAVAAPVGLVRLQSADRVPRVRDWAA